MMHDHDDDVDGGHATLHNLVAQVDAQLQWLRFPTKTASDAAPVHRFASKTRMLRLLLHLARAKKTNALFHLAQPKTQMRQLRLQQTRSKTQMRSVTPTPRRLGPMKQRHDAARRSRFDGANEEADGNTDATTRRRDDGANAEGDGNNDGTRRCGAA